MSRMQRPHQKQQQHKRGPDRLVADKDEWDDLPFVRGGGAASPPHLAAQADNHPRTAYPRPQQHSPRQQQHPPRLKPQPKQQPRNAPQQRKRSRSSGDPPAGSKMSPAAGQAVGQSSSSNPGSRLSRAVTVPYSVPSGPVVVAPTLVANQQQQQQQQQKKKEKEPVMCRGFAAGYCSTGVGCFDIHDGRACEERRTAWLAGGRLPDPQPPRWSLMIETASRGGGRYGGLPGIAAGVPPVLVIAGMHIF